MYKTGVRQKCTSPCRTGSSVATAGISP